MLVLSVDIFLHRAGKRIQAILEVLFYTSYFSTVRLSCREKHLPDFLCGGHTTLFMFLNFLSVLHTMGSLLQKPFTEKNSEICETDRTVHASINLLKQL